MIFDIASVDGTNGMRLFRQQDFLKFEVVRNSAVQAGTSRLQYRTRFPTAGSAFSTQPQEPYNEVMVVTVVLSVSSNTQQMFVNGVPVPADADGNLGTLPFDSAAGQFAYPRSGRYTVVIGKQADTSRPAYSLTGGEIFFYSGSFHYFGVLDSSVDSADENSELRRLVSGSCCTNARYGITCTGLEVTGIDLSSNGVIGSLPSTFFTYFKQLKAFDISSQCSQAAQCQNIVASVFTPQLYLPPTLVTLVLSFNNIQGALPQDVLRGAHPALTTLDVSGNSLSGKQAPHLPLHFSPVPQARCLRSKRTAPSCATAFASTVFSVLSTTQSADAEALLTWTCRSTC
jgi:hypothetical protein